jgi:SAM-dependent methyltransferase
MLDAIQERFIRANQTSGQHRLASEDLARINEMLATLASGEPLTRPSRYWEELNKMNMAQLNEQGYENFKKTIALNYFTWVRILPWDSQIVFLCKNLPLGVIARSLRGAFSICRQKYFSSMGVFQSFCYGFLTLLLWEYLFKLSLPAEMMALREPTEGNAPIVNPRPGMPISQDLGNSLLEFDSFEQAIPATRPSTVLELGAGYGRNAYTILSLRPQAKYIIVDIPPALWVAERYLSSVFPDKRIFRYRDFDRFDSVAEEFSQAQIAFVLASQLSLIPADSVDLIINISSLHEMRRDQIDFYFEQFGRILSPGGHCYIKEWKVGKVLFEGITLSEADYRPPADWAKVLHRTARVQTKFFESLYKKS